MRMSWTSLCAVQCRGGRGCARSQDRTLGPGVSRCIVGGTVLRSPERTLQATSPIATPEEEHAVEYVSLGPPPARTQSQSTQQRRRPWRSMQSRAWNALRPLGMQSVVALVYLLSSTYAGSNKNTTALAQRCDQSGGRATIDRDRARELDEDPRRRIASTMSGAGITRSRRRNTNTSGKLNSRFCVYLDGEGSCHSDYGRCE